MYLADYHIHSRISPDAGTSMAEMAEAALAAGMDEICFTDHVELLPCSGGIAPEQYGWEALAAEYEAACAALGDRVVIRLGIELGNAFLDFSHAERLLADAPPLDFIIGSDHLLPERYDSIDLSWFRPKNEAEALEGIRDYLPLVRKMAAWKGFQVLGHLTLPLRYLNEGRGFRLSFGGFEAEVADIFRALIENGRGIEVNVNRGGMLLPDGKWLRLYRELGGEIVTLGTDAHTPEYVGRAIREGQALLRSCGFTRFCTFARQRPIWHEL